MARAVRKQTRLRLVSDAWGRGTEVAGVRIVAAPEDEPPFPVDAVAAEEDTHLLLSVEEELREPVESLSELASAAATARVATPGSVVVQPLRPVRLLAIVHDIDRQPTWREAWIASALDGILRVAHDRCLAAVGLPPIGSRHGSLSTSRFAALLRRSLERSRRPWPKRLWLIAADPSAREMLSVLRTGPRRR